MTAVVLITGPVAPVLQEYVLAPEAVKLIAAPAHTEMLEADKRIAGEGFTVSWAAPVPAQPKASVPITKYEALLRGIVVMVEPLAPVFQL